MEKSHIFFNRELSWIEFNARVLYEAQRKEKPLTERLKLISIVSTNFDEFFMVRVAGLKRQALKTPEEKDIAGLTPAEQLIRISRRVHEIDTIRNQVLHQDILQAFAQNGIEYISPEQYTEEQKGFTRHIFNQEIFPLLTPLKTEGNIFPYVTNLHLYAAFALSPLPNIEQVKTPFVPEEPQTPIAIVGIPSNLSQIITLPSYSGKKQFTLLEDIVQTYATQLFPGYTVTETLLFRVTRDADFPVEENISVNLTLAMERVLEKRQESLVVRLQCTDTSTFIRTFLMEKLQVNKTDVYTTSGILTPTSLLPITEWPEMQALHGEKWEHFFPYQFEKNQPVWDTLKQRDILLHVPYESYEPVVDFIKKAVDDPLTLSIKMTLYRTSDNSPIIKALERAARKGKQVTAFVELKARFNEKQNISWAAKLEKAGATVVRGILNFKVHAKILLVIRREETEICRYLHLSTGNYNDKTAKAYVDLSLFTTNHELAKDHTLFFNIISGYSIIPPMQRLLMAPVNLKSRLLELIDREIQHSIPEAPGLIVAKMNNLCDKELIQALYKASTAGVRVLLNVRGICVLMPGVPGLSENIQVISIIDHYLEHSRIFYFQNAGAEELYLSSADWMPRNMERRIELMFPILQKDIFQELKDILFLYFQDTEQSHQLCSDGHWLPKLPKPGEEPVRVQRKLYHRYKKREESKSQSPTLDFVVRR